MRVLHYYPKNDSMIASYVNMLVSNMGLETENSIASTESDAKEKLNMLDCDILHIHGCWRTSAARVMKTAFKQGARLVLSPYGQLEPWIIDDRYWKEKLPKRLLFQRDIVSKAYAVIIQGHMEDESLRKLGWNMRTVIIRNPIITQSITPLEMARQTYSVYRQVMDSNTLELMDDETTDMLKTLIKAGITKDSRWLQPLDPATLSLQDQEQWRMLICHAHQEQIEDILRRGIHVLGISVPDIDTSKTKFFLPDDYEPSKSIQEEIGMQFASENDRLMATFRHIRRLLLRRKLTLSHLCELDRELREHDCEEDQLCETLKEARLYKAARRMMQLMNELTGLDEGFMPLPPLDDRITKQIKKQINNHLRI